ncbi:MAG: amidohydrolase family protein, partial [Woeseiaceae bacterium]
MHQRLLGTLLSLLFVHSAHADGDITLVYAGTLLAVPGEAPLVEQTITIEGNRIARIEAGFLEPQDADVRVIDLSDKFVLPGLMDMHVHLLGELGPTSRIDQLNETTSMAALKG